MTIDARQFFPLDRAYLCQDCESVGNSSMRCPACSSGALLGLAGVLDREVAAQPARLLLFPALAA